MPTILSLAVAASVITASLAIPSTAQAQEYPWCARYADDHGGANCGFATLDQCAAALAGNGGLCDRNLFYAPPSSPAPGSASGRRSEADGRPLRSKPAPRS